MLTLRAFGPGSNLPSQSPFVMKIMGYLHLLGLDWQIDVKADIRAQPSGKFPVLVDGDQVIADSGAIALYLEAKAGHTLNDHLTDTQKTLSHTLVRMAEEHIYFYVVHNRWSVDENFALIRPSLEKLAPFPISKILPRIIRKNAVGQPRAQGVGRMSPDMQAARLAADFDVLERQIGDGPWLFGADPCAADLSTAPMLAQILACPADTEIRRALTKRPALTAYTNRAVAELFPAHDTLPFPRRP